MASRVFMAGVALTVLFACGHFLGFLQARRAARHDPALAQATSAMREVTSGMGGMRATLLDFREFFSASFSPLLIAIAGLSLVARGLAADPVAAVRAVSIVNAMLMGVILALSVIYRVFQGVVSAGVILVVFVAAAVLA